MKWTQKALLLSWVLGLALLMGGCQPAVGSEEGRMEALVAILDQPEIAEEVTEAKALNLITTWDAESMETTLNHLSFEVLKRESKLLTRIMDQGFPKWQYNLEGFAITYLKQESALLGLETSVVAKDEPPITIIENCLSSADVLNAFIKQVTGDGKVAKEDLFVAHSSIKGSWQVVGGKPTLTWLELEIYNIIENKHYRVEFRSASLTITNIPRKTVDFHDMSVSESAKASMEADFVSLIPLDILVPVRLDFTAYSDATSEEGAGLALAEKSDDGFVPKSDGAYSEILGTLGLYWVAADGEKTLDYQLVSGVKE